MIVSYRGCALRLQVNDDEVMRLKRYITAALTALLVLVLSITLIFFVGILLPDDSAPTESGQPSQKVNYSLYISEICSKNESVIVDVDGRHRDYIEIYNAGDTVDLAGLYFSDGKVSSKPLDSTILPAGCYLVIFLADDLTGFALGASGGDQLQMLDPQGNILQQVVTVPMGPDQVMVYDNGKYTVSNDPSPGFPNDEMGVKLFRYGMEDTNPKIVFSELLMDNRYALPDEQLVYSDVLELQNISEEPVQLSDYYLADRLENRFDYRLPEVELAPGEYILIWCDGGNYVSENGQIHADFRISQGEILYLTTRDHYYVSLEAISAGTDMSLSRREDGSYTPGEVSLGYANDVDGVAQFIDSRTATDSSLVINEVLMSSANVPYLGGFYDVIEIWNRSEQTVNTEGWFLTDGKDPFKYALPAQDIGPHSYILILCGPDTTGFSLSKTDVLRLTGPDHRSTPQIACLADAFSRQETEGEVSYMTMGVTLGYANTADNHIQYLKDQYGGGLMISEVMSVNNSYLPGAYATTCDWIELYNASDADILLSDYYFSNKDDYLLRYRLPEQTLKAGAYCVIFLSKDNRNLLKGYPVLPFALSSAGEDLYLSNADGIVDYVQVPALQVDTTYGRPNSSIEFALLADVTPGKANGEAAQNTEAPTATLPQGSYDDVESLEISFSGEGNIYYTTDCTVPTAQSTLYTGPIHITKTTVFRVIAIENGKRPSKVVDLTYLVNEGDALGVVTIVTHPDNLWDWETGIYVDGPNASNKEPGYGANYWMDWEKEATVSMFENTGGGFESVGCGIKVFGGYSRYQPKKSLVCFFRKEYGASELDYALFGDEGPDTFEAFVLRNSGQDILLSRIRDEVITSLVSEYTTVAVQKFKPVVVYLNGKYYGLHFVREKLNTNYVAGNFNTTADNVILCEQGGYNSYSYRSLLSYAMNHDMRNKQYYDYVCSQIDVDNYIDYMVAQLFIANTDNGNVRFFRIGNGKWTWIMYDTDLSFYDSSINSLRSHLNPNYIGNNDSTSKTLAVCLLKNPEFKEKFIRRIAWQMENIWTEENVVSRVDEIEAMISQDMIKDCRRWGTSYSGWQNSVNTLRRYVRNRRARFPAMVQAYFGLTDAQMVEYGFPV